MPTACHAHGHQAVTLTGQSAASAGQWRLQSSHSAGSCSDLCSKCITGQRQHHGPSWHYYSTHTPPNASSMLHPAITARLTNQLSSHSSQAAPCLPQPCSTATISMQHHHGLVLHMPYTCHAPLIHISHATHWSGQVALAAVLAGMLSQHVLLVEHEQCPASSVL